MRFPKLPPPGASRASGNHKANNRLDGNIAVVGDHRFIINSRQRIVQVELLKV
jgi:hypothetical protein